MKQFKDTVAIKDIEIAKLQSDNETLKSELLKIKNRYKGIRQILDQAELKEKVEILIEVEKLRKVRMLKIAISRTENTYRNYKSLTRIIPLIIHLLRNFRFVMKCPKI